ATMAETRLMLMGAGKIGGAIVTLLQATGDYRITVVEQDRERLLAFRDAGHRTHESALADARELARLLRGHDAVISACPYHLTPLIARAAKQAGVHYFDLTEDVASTREVKKLALGAETAFVPQCGLAPGFISIAAHSVAQGFDALRDV